MNFPTNHWRYDFPADFTFDDDEVTQDIIAGMACSDTIDAEDLKRSFPPGVLQEVAVMLATDTELSAWAPQVAAIAAAAKAEMEAGPYYLRIDRARRALIVRCRDGDVFEIRPAGSEHGGVYYLLCLGGAAIAGGGALVEDWEPGIEIGRERMLAALLQLDQMT